MVGFGDWRSCPLVVRANDKIAELSNEERTGLAIVGGATLALAGVLAYRRCVMISSIV